MAKYSVPGKKSEVDPFDLLCERVDRISPSYSSTSYWGLMQEACDAVRHGEITEELAGKIKREHRSWGMRTSNKESLALLLDRMGVL